MDRSWVSSVQLCFALIKNFPTFKYQTWFFIIPFAISFPIIQSLFIYMISLIWYITVFWIVGSYKVPSCVVSGHSIHSSNTLRLVVTTHRVTMDSRYIVHAMSWSETIVPVIILWFLLTPIHHHKLIVFVTPTLMVLFNVVTSPSVPPDWISIPLPIILRQGSPFFYVWRGVSNKLNMFVFFITY